VPFAPNTDLERHTAIIDELRREGVTINKDRSLQTLAASDFAVIASGTATLQAVLLGVPLVVIYKVFPLTFWLGKRIVKVRFASLVNILSGREVVKELLQKEASVPNILLELKRLKEDVPYREQMRHAYDEVRRLFDEKHASSRVSDMVIEMAGWKACS
jgi:lipid-A-disaccharide synthase